MEFTSKELQNAIEIAPTITYNKPELIDSNFLKNNLKILVISKNQYLLRPFEFSQMVKSNNNSGLNTLKIFLNIVRDYMAMSFREDNIKNLSIRKNIDIMCLSLEASLINGIDINTNELNALMLGFLTENFV